MPSKNMLPKGKRRHTVKHEYRAARTLANERAEAERARAAEAFGQEPEEAATELLETADFMEQEPTLEERIASNDWITTKGATGSKVAQETHDPPRYSNRYATVHETPKPDIQARGDIIAADGKRSFKAEPAASGLRLDAYVAKAIPDISRARVQMLIDAGQIKVDSQAVKASFKLKGGEQIVIEGEPRPGPIRATPEDIPLTVVYEDKDLAVIDKPAGMMVHAGSGSSEHNKGTLVNALLYRFGANLSSGGDADARYEMRDGDEEDLEEAEESDDEGISHPASRISVPRPGIVHRLDKDTSGLIIVAKNDSAHRKLGEMFSGRRVSKTYLALVHGWFDEDDGTINLPISRDLTRRIRMTTKRPKGSAGARHAVSHWHVLERLETAYGKFTLVEVRIETGRTHQIRVHLQALGHAVVGDTLYGAPARLIVPKRKGAASVQSEELSLARNFLHAAELEFAHPRTGKTLALRTELPPELTALLEQLRGAELIR